MLTGHVNESALLFLTISLWPWSSCWWRNKLICIATNHAHRDTFMPYSLRHRILPALLILKAIFLRNKEEKPNISRKNEETVNLTHRFQSFYFRTWGHCFFTSSLPSYRSMYLSSYFACTFMLILLPRYKSWRKKEATGQVNCEKFIFLK